MSILDKLCTNFVLAIGTLAVAFILGVVTYWAGVWCAESAELLKSAESSSFTEVFAFVSLMMTGVLTIVSGFGCVVLTVFAATSIFGFNPIAEWCLDN